MFTKGPAVKPLTTSGKGAITTRQCESLVRVVMQQGFREDFTGRKVARGGHENDGPADLIFSAPGEPRHPDEIFHRLRWGGLFVYVGTHPGKVRRLCEQYEQMPGFRVERQVKTLYASPLGLYLPGISKRGYYFTVRKTHLIRPGEFTERFTYDVHLVPDPSTRNGYIVEKKVPTEADILERLKKKLPDAEEADLQQRAHKLVQHIFPTFLTREAAMLKILQRDLPPTYRHRVPRLLFANTDDRGMVTTLRMNWLRVSGPVLSQLEFAKQAAELLTVLHEHARVIHLDLRLDNLVITQHGVGFVDFGSAVRIGEQLEQSPMLTTLFEEMMRTSQIQRMLGKMLETGRVTNQAIANVHQKVDKTLDTFYLAVLITRPKGNPLLDGLIDFDPKLPEAQALAALTAAVLRPKDPKLGHFKTSADILRGIRRIEEKYTAVAA